MKKALVTGVAGQDGSYLAELLLNKGYEVHGLVIELPNEGNLQRFFRIRDVFSRIVLHEGDVNDQECVTRLLLEINPDEIYDLAAIVDTSISLATERKILLNNISGIHNILGVTKEHSLRSKIFFASSGLIFGSPSISPQNELTPKEPTTPYGIAKAAGCNLVRMYRDAHGVFACSGILYNHESPRRDSKFLPKKITEAAVRIKKGLQQELRLGDIDAVRDWGFSGDYVEVMWRMLQQDKPEDYVIGTGIAHSVRDILDVAFGALQLDWKRFVIVDQAFVRPREQCPLIADTKKAREKLRWEAKTQFEELIRMMVEHDVNTIYR